MIYFTPSAWLRLGPLTISTHALMMVTGIFVAYFLARREAKRRNDLSVDIVDGVINWAVIGGMVGARLGYVVLNPGYYTNLIDILKIWQGGLVSFGGVLGGFIGVLIYLRHKKVDWAPYADLLAPYALLGWGIGRIGDFLAWEEFGTITSLPWGVNAGFGVARHPVQLYTLLTMTVGFVLLQRLKKTSRAVERGYIFMAAGVYYFTERFMMEFLRDDKYGAAQLVSYRYFAQFMSLGLLAIIVVWFAYQRKKKKTI